MGFNKLSYIIIAILVFSSGCVTQKKKGDVSKLGKFYHNTTSHYNGYFNANELYEASILQLESQYQDNYNEILPIFPYQQSADPSIASQDLDNAILKVSNVVTYHRPGSWTDDCYLLMSKCQYAKQDYESAEKTLEFMTDEFDPANRKKILKKKKKKSPPKKKKISKKKKRKNKKKAAKKRKKQAKRKKNNKPADKSKEVDTTLQPQAPDKKEEVKKTKEDNEAYYDGMLWLAKTYSQREQFDNAYYILRSLESEGGYGNETAKYLPLGMAEYYIKLRQFKSAIPYLQQAIERADDKYKKARYAFISGQLLQQVGSYAEASSMFEKCASMHPNYEMEFMARLNSIKNKWKQTGAGLDQLESSLLKMLSESKNEEYKDMIYYTLGDVALDKKDYKNAIKYFKQCLGAKGKNIHQKVESYYQIADISYHLENYQQAHIYYDSTRNVMPQTDSRLAIVTKRAENLKPIAFNLKIIEDRDSLLHIATLSEEEQEEWAQDVFAQRKEKEKALNKSMAGISDKPKSGTRRVNLNISAANAGGSGSASFFAYNDKAIKRGEKAFARIWGSRPLADNWRRQSAISSFDYEDYDEDAFSTVATDEDLQEILKLLPNNKTKKDVSLAAIESSLFNLGGLYGTNLDAYDKSISALDKLLRRFPETKNKLDAYYLLFIAHQHLGHTSQANQFKQKIIDEFPGSEYAKFLSDPDYFNKQKSKEESLANFYEQLYVTFNSGDYTKFDNDLTKGEELFKSLGEYEARIRLLQAMTAGRDGSKEEYVAALKDFIIKHPNSPEEVRAKEMLRFMGEEAEDANSKSGKKDDIQKRGGNYKVEEDVVHFMVAEFDGLNSGELNDVKNNIQSFNDKYFQLKKLKLANIYIDYKTKKPVILVRKFLNKKDAMNYYKVVTKNLDEFVTPGTTMKYYMVTQNNYRQILLVRNLDSYDSFFQEEYLDK